MTAMNPAIPFMILDIVKETLSLTDDIPSMGKKLSMLIREITGARAVIFLEFLGDRTQYHINTIEPKRYYESFPKTLIDMLLEDWYKFTTITIVNNQSCTAHIADFLNEQHFKNNLICPLYAHNRKIGMLMVFGVFDLNILNPIQQIFSVLLDIVGMILENSRLIHHQEKLLSARTKDLQLALERAESANQAKSMFLSNMSHEIRTPMNSILGFTEVLSRLEEDPEKCRFIENISISGQSLLSLINDVLDLSKIESGKMELTFSPTTLTSLFFELEILFSEKMQKKGITFEIHISNDIPPVLLMDKERLSQVLINLVGNAWKFTQKGFVKIYVSTTSELCLHDIYHTLTIVVEDSGIGIPKEQFSTIFESFEQIKRRTGTTYGGTGLGLAISKRIIELMNGIIFAESNLNKGTKFTITIPNLKEEKGVIIEDKSKTIPRNLSFSPATILIVDDIKMNQEIIEGFLSEFNFTFKFAANGKEAINLVAESKPDLILLDMKMPVMDGYEVARRLKGSTQTARIPIISITASALKHDEERITLLCDGYLRKPINRMGLIKSILPFLDHTPEIDDAPEKTVETTVEPDEIIPPAREFLELFIQFAQRGNITGIRTLSENLKKKDPQLLPFCRHIDTLSKSFDDEKIIEFVRTHIT